MTTHTKTYTNRYLLERLKNRSLAVCHAFKIDKNAIRAAGVIRSEKYSAVPTNAAIRSKNVFICWQNLHNVKSRDYYWLLIDKNNVEIKAGQNGHVIYKLQTFN